MAYILYSRTSAGTFGAFQANLYRVDQNAVNQGAIVIEKDTRLNVGEAFDAQVSASGLTTGATITEMYHYGAYFSGVTNEEQEYLYVGLSDGTGLVIYVDIHARQQGAYGPYEQNNGLGFLSQSFAAPVTSFAYADMYQQFSYPVQAVDDAFDGTENVPFTGNVLDNDPQTGFAPQFVNSYTQPTYQKLTANGLETWSAGTVTMDLLTGEFTLTPNRGISGPITFSYEMTDANATTDTATVTVTMANVFTDPILIVPSTLSTVEGFALSFNSADGTAITMSDGDSSVILYMRASNGALSIDSPYVVNEYSVIGGSSAYEIMVMGTQEGLNTALETLVFTPDSGFFGDATLEVIYTDRTFADFTINGPEFSESYTISVTGVNDAPVNTVPAAFAAAQAGHTLLNAFGVSDDGVGTTTLSVTLSALNGDLTITTPGSATITGNSSKTLELTGTVASLNAALASVSYSPDDGYAGPDTITMSTTESGSTDPGGPLSDTDTISVTVNAPVLAVSSGTQTATGTEDIPIDLSALLAVTDADTGNTLTWTLASDPNDLDGQLSGLGAPGAQTSNGGQVTPSIIYTPNQDFNGADSFTVRVSDGLVSTDIDVSVGLAAVNDLPTVSGDLTLRVQRDTVTPITLADVTITDVDSSLLHVDVIPSAVNPNGLGPDDIGYFARASDPDTPLLRWTAYDMVNGNIVYVPRGAVTGKNIDLVDFAYELTMVNIPYIPGSDPVATFDLQIDRVSTPMFAVFPQYPIYTNENATDLSIFDFEAFDRDIEDQSAISFTLSGPVAPFLEMVGTELHWKTAPDYENRFVPISQYYVDVGIGSPDGDFYTGRVRMNVLNVYEPIEFDGLPSAITVDETSSFVVDVQTFYGDLGYDVNDGYVEYRLNEVFVAGPDGFGPADDVQSFHIDPESGVLTFVTPPSVSSPGDLNGDNVYEVTVIATYMSDTTQEVSQTLSITVGPVQLIDLENGSFTRNDGYVWDAGTVYEGRSANDLIATELAGSTVNGNDGNDTILGEQGNDSLSGGSGADSLSGGRGADDLNGNAGNDWVVGGGQADTLRGGNGNDTLDGGFGADDLLGGNGNDLLLGGVGGDSLIGGQGNDKLRGLDGDDLLNGGGGGDRLFGGDGADTIIGGAGKDRLGGGAGNDDLAGGGNNDTLIGGAGDDTLSGEVGNDLLTGGAGFDTFIYEPGFGNDVITDFDADDAERLNLSAVTEIVGFWDLINNHLGTVDGHAQILTTSGTIDLLDVAESDIAFGGLYSAADFIFA